MGTVCGSGGAGVGGCMRGCGGGCGFESRCECAPK